jgi:hypothetical protein
MGNAGDERVLTGAEGSRPGRRLAGAAHTACGAARRTRFPMRTVMCIASIGRQRADISRHTSGWDTHSRPQDRRSASGTYAGRDVSERSRQIISCGSDGAWAAAGPADATSAGRAVAGVTRPVVFGRVTFIASDVGLSPLQRRLHSVPDHGPAAGTGTGQMDTSEPPAPAQGR